MIKRSLWTLILLILWSTAQARGEEVLNFSPNSILLPWRAVRTSLLNPLTPSNAQEALSRCSELERIFGKIFDKFNAGILERDFLHTGKTDCSEDKRTYSTGKGNAIFSLKLLLKNASYEEQNLNGVSVKRHSALDYLQIVLPSFKPETAPCEYFRDKLKGIVLKTKKTLTFEYTYCSGDGFLTPVLEISRLNRGQYDEYLKRMFNNASHFQIGPFAVPEPIDQSGP